ncbi:hypothetical protein [Zoogloea sp.]|uniref:hypothetical protein n=1 Tax=Zoogloea sp. TaxID=49181 RepID=UPI001AD40C68|nr:hypothetical protein [Zoogloea sp.]MBN8285471.1 hypothetical protein [Zoogloea sp.]
MSNTTQNPLLDEAPEDTANNVADVLEFLSVSLVVLSKTGISPAVASGMSHVLGCCASALKGVEC